MCLNLKKQRFFYFAFVKKKRNVAGIQIFPVISDNTTPNASGTIVDARCRSRYQIHIHRRVALFQRLQTNQPFAHKRNPLSKSPATNSPILDCQNPNKSNTAMASSPAILPISNPQTISAGESQAPIATPAFRAFINKIAENVRSGLSARRPWSELVDRSAFSKPDSITDAVSRIRKNYSYFRVNYITVVVAVLGFSLLTNPFSLIILLGLLAAWFFLYLFRPSDPPLVIFGRTFSERETLGLLIVSSIVVIFLTSVGSVLISALLLGTAVVSAHGAFRTPEDLFLDEQEPGASTGFLSFLSGAAANAAASAAPVVAAARV